MAARTACSLDDDPADGETGCCACPWMRSTTLSPTVRKSPRPFRADLRIRGVCAKCYGWSLATNKLVDVGEARHVAAQSIGEL